MSQIAPLKYTHTQQINKSPGFTYVQSLPGPYFTLSLGSIFIHGALGENMWKYEDNKQWRAARRRCESCLLRTQSVENTAADLLCGSGRSLLMFYTRRTTSGQRVHSASNVTSLEPRRTEQSYSLVLSFPVLLRITKTGREGSEPLKVLWMFCFRYRTFSSACPLRFNILWLGLFGVRQLDQIPLVELRIWFFGKGQALTIREEKENFIIALLKNFKEDTP